MMEWLKLFFIQLGTGPVEKSVLANWIARCIFGENSFGNDYTPCLNIFFWVSIYVGMIYFFCE
jgi:hypothetical protein